MIPPRLDLNLLVSLDVLLAERNVTRAGQRLGLSQPALSAQLKQLREAFADPLLIPAARGMTPTARAEALRAPLRQLLGELQGLVASGRRFDPATAQQTFRIVASDAIHNAASAPLAARLAREAPGCRLALMAADLRGVVELMAAGEIDLMLAARPSMPAALHARPLYDEQFLCVMRREHPAAAEPLDLDRFCALDHVLVSPSGGGFHGTVDEALAALGRSRRVAISVNSFMLVPAVLAGSDLIATVPARLARAWGQTLAVLAPPCDVAGFSVLMGWHPRAHADPAQLWLREALSASLRTA
ncbi:LysR family transcriptional regulator [Niveibacterium umoris]